MSFTRKKENFVCEHCGHQVEGTGYTNHCPKCLWSKHFDIEPGDRAQSCGGLMAPIDVFYQSGEWVVVHECQKCGERRRKKITPKDEFEEVIRLKQKKKKKKVKG